MRSIIVAAVGAIGFIAAGTAAAQTERQPMIKGPIFGKQQAKATAAGSIGVCVYRLLYREEAGLTAVNGNGRTVGGQEVAFYFTAAGGVLILNNASAVVPAATSGWTADKTNNLADFVAQAAANRRTVTFEYGASSTANQPITGVQISPVEDECKV